MAIRLPLGLLLASIAWACSEAPEPAPTTTVTTEATSTTIAATSTTTTAPAEIDAGRLAIVDDAGNVAVVDPDGSDRVDITNDGSEVVYSQPTWSPDGSRLAFSRLSGDSASLRIERVDGDGSSTVPMSNLPFYASWSPDGETIGVLHNGVGGLDLTIVDVAEATTSVVHRGAPLYFSWSPEGDRIAVHVGAGRLDALDLDGGRQGVGDTSPGYLSPQWLPGGILHVSGGHLVIDDGNRSEVAVVGEQTLFVANPQGTKVAVQSLGEGDAITVALGAAETITPNSVAVVDIDSGQVEMVQREPAVGFWWSPDGNSLLTLRATMDQTSLIAAVWSPGSELVDHAAYRPSPAQVRELLPFFPQYAQSMTFWAPDSSAFAIAGEIDGETGVWVQAIAGGSPRLVAEGEWVSWSGVDGR